MSDRLAELAALASTQEPRCLGCAGRLAADGRCDGAHCPSFYGTGLRVDYGAWCELVGRHMDEPLFRVWAEAEPQHGVPSWWPAHGRPSTVRYHEAHGDRCDCGRCVPSLRDLRSLVSADAGRADFAGLVLLLGVMALMVSLVAPLGFRVAELLSGGGL